MGGRSRSKSSVVTETNTSNIALTDSDGSQILDAGGDIEITDAGAIDRAFQFGENSLIGFSDNLAELLDFGAEIQESNQSALNTAAAAVTGESRAATQNAELIRQLVIGGIAIAVIIFGFRAFSR